jgi:hypothetical protein
LALLGVLVVVSGGDLAHLATLHRRGLVVA